MRRPEFISRSRQRVRRLALQAEERKLQAVFSRERELYNHPGGLGRLPRPAGTRQAGEQSFTFYCNVGSSGCCC